MEREVRLELGGKTYVLTPTLDAMLKINRQFSSIVDCSVRLRRYDFEAVAFVISAGAGLSPKQSDQMQRELVAHGLVGPVQKLAEYIKLLLNPEGLEQEEGTEPGEA